MGINMHEDILSDLDVIRTRHIVRLLQKKNQTCDDDSNGNKFLEECLEERIQQD